MKESPLKNWGIILPLFNPILLVLKYIQRIYHDYPLLLLLLAAPIHPVLPRRK